MKFRFSFILCLIVAYFQFCTSLFAAEAQNYVVQPRDTLWKIAQKVYSDGYKYKLILKANNLKNPVKPKIEF